MSRPVPKNEEAEFNINELFFSKTDDRGIILAANSVFFRVSGYSEQQMIGAPHSLIRHPDMPRAVFKYFWERLKAGQPIIAYVKNLASDGRYYWVLASATPVKDGYISIRLKPTTDIRKTVQDLYAKVLEVERREGLEKSYEFLFEQVRSLGYSNYLQFSQHALAQELESRAAQLSSEANIGRLTRADSTASQMPSDQQALFNLLQMLTSHCSDVLKLYSDVNQRLHRLNLAKDHLETGSREIKSAYDVVKYLPLNMTVESERVGSEGAVLAVVSETFKRWFQEATGSLHGFFAASDLIAKNLESSGYKVAASQLQAELIQFLANEILHSLADERMQRTFDCDQAKGELADFAGMAHSVLESVNQELLSLLDVAKNVSNCAQQLRDAAKALSIIRQSGRVETERLSNGKEGFHAHLENMASFLGLVDRELNTIEKDASTTLSDVTAIQSALYLMLEICDQSHFNEPSLLAAAE